MTKEEFITGEIYSYCGIEYCYLGYGRKVDGGIASYFVLEKYPKIQVVLGPETLKRMHLAERKYLTISKMEEGKIYVTKNGKKIIGRKEAELDDYRYVVKRENVKPFIFKLADSSDTINLDCQDIRKLKLLKEQ